MPAATTATVTGAPPSPAPARRRVDTTDVALVALPALLAAALSAISLTARSIGFDEGATVAIASQHGHALWHAIARDGGNMSGYYLALHVLIGWFGDGPWVLRTPSLVGAAATAGLIAALGRTLFDRRVAAVAGLLGAVSLPLVFWGQTARSYALMLAFVCAGMLAFVALVRAREDGRRWLWPAAAYVVAMGLAAYCSFVAVLVVLAQAPALWGRPRAARRFAGALVVLAASAVPLAVLARRRGSGQLFWLPHPSRQVETQVLQTLTSAGLQPSFHRVFSTTVGWAATVVAVLAVGVLAVRARRARAGAGADPPGGGEPVCTRRAETGTAAADPLASWATALVLCWAIVPAAVAFVYSLVAPQPLFLARNLLVSVPAVALVLAAGIADRRLPRWAAGGALVIALLVRVAPLAASYGVSPEPWRQATQRVLAGARPGDCVIFYPEDGRNAFRWSASRAGALDRAPRSVLPDVPWSRTSPYVEIYDAPVRARIAGLRRGGCARMWLVSSHEGQAHGPSRSRVNRARWWALRRELARAYGPAVSSQKLGYASAVDVLLYAGR